MFNPIIPMFVVSGAPSREDISNALESLKSVGIDQIMLYPRKGCELTYMSMEWVRLVQNVLLELQERDMRVWINDDFHFPSGNADGTVTENNDYCSKTITIRGENKGKRNFVTDETPKNKRFADVLNNEAMSLFLKNSHERYYNLFGKYFGTTIAGFYTDEPSFGYLLGENDLPYYNGLEDDYMEVFARMFEDDLEDEYELFESNVMSLVTERFHKCYSKQLSYWCREHKVLMMGHLMEDDSPKNSTRYNGNILKVLKRFGVPGIDEIWTDPTRPTTLTLLGCADYAKNDVGAMAELFALGPVNMSYQKQCMMIYLCSCFGINHYVIALSHVNVKGNKIINNYFNHFGKSRPDFGGMEYLVEHSKIAADVAITSFIPEVYVKYPSDILSECLVSNPAKCDDINDKFIKLINELSKNQIQWRYIEPNTTTTDDTPVVSIGEAKYLLNGVESDLENAIDSLRTDYTLTTIDGKAPDGFFVRKLSDGRVLAINHSGKEGAYIFCGKETYIGEHGVVISTEGPNYVHPTKEITGLSLEVEYKNNNVARLMFLNNNNVAKIKCESDVYAVFVVRDDSIELTKYDNKLLDLSPCDILGDEFNLLYEKSKTLGIKQGEHVVNSGYDYKYLPSVMVFGDFKVEYNSGDICTAILSTRDNRLKMGDIIKDHGVVAFKAQISVPVGTRIIKIVGTTNFTKVYANGVELDNHLYSPYEFLIDKFDGTVNLEIVEYSSIGSLFGDTNYFNYHQDEIKWKSTKPSSVSTFGVEKIQLF